MKIPLSWLNDFVDIDLPLPELAYRLTMAGLEVEGIQYVGLPCRPRKRRPERPTSTSAGLGWEPDKIVVAADRLR